MKEGKVDLTWTRIGIEDDQKLKIVWREHDGPTVTPPTSRGLGTALIEHGIAGSRAQSSFDAAGVTWTFEVPLQSAATNSLSQSTH
ncbi:MAG: hypothetical protein ACXW4C_11295 [Nitrospira sp.]